VFAAKGASSRLVITATSGTAAAGIGGTTIHSAVGLTFKDQDGVSSDTTMTANLDKAKQRWRRRDVLVIDEVSMLGLLTLYDIDKKLRVLRGFPEKPFGGMPVVIFTGDFLQFGPVNQSSLLKDFKRSDDLRKYSTMSQRSLDKRLKETEAQKLWLQFTNVVMLEEQKRAEGDAYLLGLLERIREDKQTAEDAERLQTRYRPDLTLDFTGGRRAIIPLNRHRWDMTLHAALAYSAETGRKMSLYLSGHKWESRVPGLEERTAAMLLGDGNNLPVAGMFPYVEGMPVVVNENKYMGLKVVNGAEFTAVKVLHPPGLEEIRISDQLSIFLGPPTGIVLRSKETTGLAFPNLPINTVALPAKNVQVDKKYGNFLRPGMLNNTKPGVVRTGLPCSPAFALTDFKSQGRTLEKTLLGLYGTKQGATSTQRSKCAAISMYVQLSRARRFEDIALIEPLNVADFLKERMPDDQIDGIRRLNTLAEESIAGFEAAHGRQG
ncbi:DNA repair and recombination protein, partial [Colletotrichum musicola]